MSEKELETIRQSAIEYNYYVGSLDNAAAILSEAKAKSKNIFIYFNGKKLFSQLDNLDTCYLKVTGKTKNAFDEEVQSYYSRFNPIAER